ncbi:MAG TPA: phosphate acyltransferase PlsX [Caulobacteraceae bacterium]|nr:phosphate acyltransferase PlsX [Caulobacteraceae bacterium]
MSDPLVISVDAMGGDHGPSVIVPGVAEAAASGALGDARFLLHGDAEAIEAALSHAPGRRELFEVRHTSLVVPMDAKPAQAMRRGKGTSMWNAVESVRSGEASAAVSAGNTGALMAISRLLLRMVGDLERPALVASWPTLSGVTSVLDVGANVICDTERLVEFAIMGAAFHRALHGVPRPTVGVLNIGTEHDKGHEEVRGADRTLREQTLELDYRGFVEGDDIAKGTVDVVVTDGFTGNVALKTAEGLARYFRAELRRTLTEDALARAGALVASGAIRKMSARLNPSTINGSPFLGLTGVVVKSHGGADAHGVANAVRLAATLATGGFVAEIATHLGGRGGSPGKADTERSVA